MPLFPSSGFGIVAASGASEGRPSVPPVLVQHPADPPADGFNPHGISVRPEVNLMVTSDFICPSTTLHAVPGDPEFRGSIRVWDFRARRILRTVKLPNPTGSIESASSPATRGSGPTLRA